MHWSSFNHQVSLATVLFVVLFVCENDHYAPENLDEIYEQINWVPEKNKQNENYFLSWRWLNMNALHFGHKPIIWFAAFLNQWRSYGKNEELSFCWSIKELTLILIHVSHHTFQITFQTRITTVCDLSLTRCSRRRLDASSPRWAVCRTRWMRTWSPAPGTGSPRQITSKNPCRKCVNMQII